MVEHHLGESLTTSSGTEISVEAKRLGDGKVGLDSEQRCTDTLLLGEDVTSSLGENVVDTSHGLLGNLDFDLEDRLLESRIGQESRCVQHASSGWDDLTTTTMNGIGVKSDIHDVESD
jgi:hypothetical protein